MAARLAALLAGDKPQRAAAYEELTALANGDGAEQTTRLSVASVHVGGLEGELEDEAKLAAALGGFGSVVAVTLCERRETKNGKHVVSWALLTFAEQAEAQAALDGSASLGVDGLVVRTVDTQQALGSTGAMEVMQTHHTRVAVGVATACVAPLVDSILCAEASRVDSAEAQQAYLLLGSLMLLDPLTVTAEWMKNDRWFAAWTAPSSALAATFAKEPAELTRDDVMLAACDALGITIVMSQGLCCLYPPCPTLCCSDIAVTLPQVSQRCARLRD